MLLNATFKPVFKPVMGGVFPFRPGQLFRNGEVGAWFDPSDLTTLFQDTAGTIPVAAAGQSVARMLDKSGRGHHATQATSANRPVYEVDTTGRGYLAFDGPTSNRWMVTSTITPGTNRAQIFAGVRKVGATVAVIAETGVNAGTIDGTIAVFHDGSSSPNGYGALRAVAGGSAAVNIASLFPSPISNVVTVIADEPGDTLALRVDGVQRAITTPTPGFGNFLAYPLYIGRRGGTTLPFNGRVYSLIIRFGSNLNAQHIQQVEQYVAEKTGVNL